MRSPQDLSHLPRRSARRGRVWIIVAAIILIVIFASLKTLATFFTDYLWFSSVNLSSVWRHLFVVKAGLFIGFALIFFVLLWVNLAVVDRLAPGELSLGPEDELVRRYQQRVTPRAVLVRSVVSAVVALIAASGAIGQWRNFLLFKDGVYLTGRNSTDPQFHKNIGFFLFKLPFIQFVIQWAFVSLVVMAVIVVIAHYLNGGIRVQSGAPSVGAQVKVHLSVLLACMALVKAFGYYFARYNLDLSQNGYVQGLTWTDDHARLPGAHPAHLHLAPGRRHPSHQHPAARVDAAGSGRGVVGLRGHRGGGHLSGHHPGRQGQPGPELAGAALHHPQHRRHP